MITVVVQYHKNYYDVVPPTVASGVIPDEVEPGVHRRVPLSNEAREQGNTNSTILRSLNVCCSSSSNVGRASSRLLVYYDSQKDTFSRTELPYQNSQQRVTWRNSTSCVSGELILMLPSGESPGQLSSTIPERYVVQYWSIFGHGVGLATHYCSQNIACSLYCSQKLS